MKKAWYAGFGLAALALVLFCWGCTKTEPEPGEQEVATIIQPGDGGSGGGGTTTYPVDLSADPYFFRWVSTTALNSMDLQLNWRRQLGASGLRSFRSALSATSNDAGVRSVIRQYRIDTVFADQEMAEYMARYAIVKGHHGWLFQQSAEQRLSTIRTAYFRGMESGHPDWVSLRNRLTEMANTYNRTVAPADRIDVRDVVTCVWELFKETISSLEAIGNLVSATNEGNYSAAVSAAKQVLRGMRRWGWVGLAFAAIDVAICLWNS